MVRIYRGDRSPRSPGRNFMQNWNGPSSDVYLRADVVAVHFSKACPVVYFRWDSAFGPAQTGQEHSIFRARTKCQNRPVTASCGRVPISCLHFWNSIYPRLTAKYVESLLNLFKIAICRKWFQFCHDLTPCTYILYTGIFHTR